LISGTNTFWLGISISLILLPAFYVAFATWRVTRFGLPRNAVSADRGEPVSVLKPVCGLEPDLYENLRSFCLQDYPHYQVVFGVHDSADPAIPVIRRLVSEYPGKDLALIVDGRTIGPNLKVSNLNNIYGAAKHDILVIADSDMRVGPDYLSTIVHGLSAEGVGLVTCVYKARAHRGLPSRLGAMFINEWFLPATLTAMAIRGMHFCFGATMAVRREVLAQIGGFGALASYLADDYLLGKLVMDRGFENVVWEKDFMALISHELRWARTIQSVEPLGHLFSFIMYGIPLALLAAIISELTFDWDSFEVTGIAIAIMLRVGLHHAVYATLRSSDRSSLWLLPLRDVLSFAVWGASFFGRGIRWREGGFSVSRTGHMIRKG
jgi:ceramide glucosyltransferase